MLSTTRGLIVALDMKDVTQACHIARILRDIDGNTAIKVGRILEMSTNIQVIKRIKDVVCENVPIIYDGKIADVPEITKGIAEQAFINGADAVIVHGIVGGAVCAAKELNMGQVIAVVAMSHPDAEFIYNKNSERTLDLAHIEKADGIVLPATRPQYIALMKQQTISMNCFIISPGVGAQGVKVGDAIKAGAHYEIVGRSITNSMNPADTIKRMLDSIERI